MDCQHFPRAYHEYFNQPISLKYIGSLLKFFDEPFEAVISSKSWIESYRTLNTQEDIIVESISFDNYASFLQFDYLKALQASYTLRTCNNCERIFLQTTKYHTSYCDRIYKDTNKTCRKIGSKMHHKEKVDRSPIHRLALTTYNRVAQRFNRETISDNEYINAIALINDYKDQALEGQIDVIRFENLLKGV